MHVYKPPPVGGLDRVPVFTAGTGSTRADLFELDGVTPMPGNVLVADTSGNLPSFQCATSPVFVGTSGSRTTWQPSESGTPSPAASSVITARYTDDSVSGFGALTLTLKSAGWATSADGVACQVDGTAHDTVNILQDGVYSIVVNGQMYDGAITGGTVGFNLVRAAVNVLTLDAECGPDAGGPEIDATVSPVLPLRAGDKLTVFMSGSGGVSGAGDFIQVIVTKIGDYPNP